MPAGFAAGGRPAGIKPSGRPDVALIVATAGPAAAAATFTRNLVSAAPVRLSRAHLAATGGRVRAVIVTSGSANAATGAPGDADQARIAGYVAAALGCRPDETVAASTGLIGTRLPVDAVGRAIHDLAAGGLTPDEAGLSAALEAMMTTDSRRKASSATLELPAPGGTSRTVRVTGIVKGVGMIHPNMATMIAVVLTDAAAPAGTLNDLLRPAVGSSFDMLTVDGDTSTNDTVFVLASGASGAAEILPGTPAATALGATLAAVCRSLARQQAADGEGASTLLTCRVTGAADTTDARAIARAVVGSSLLKAAVHGRDPNWGRAAAAAGAATRPDGSPVALRPEALRISLCGSAVFAGQPVVFDAASLSRVMDAPEVVFELDLGVGGASAEAWGCDLTEAYVRENSEYST